jgi:hypothetical protein
MFRHVPSDALKPIQVQQCANIALLQGKAILSRDNTAAAKTGFAGETEAGERG